jgi:tRNA A-37 threonylcarbamoyl transferase component Bud32/tetratricopeptide (TPR) repeat protein
MRQSDFDLASQPAVDPATALARGASLGRFTVLGLVGRGAMGEVYAAYDPELDRKIAIKLLRARAVEASDSRARLMREAKATAKVSHPNVVVVFDAGTFGERVFIAMEFVEGHTLRYWLQSQERTWHEVLDAFLAAGRGLAAAHDKELVHRDFKPDNVMVAAADGQVRVMDFGLARVVATAPQAGPLVDFDATIELSAGLGGGAATPFSPEASRDKLTATGAVLGTPAYMSPEQFKSQLADARSDQFSFCVALHEALYGQRPFTGRSLQELADNVIAGRIVDAPAGRRVPAWLRPILARGLSANPDERFPSMRALLDELTRHAGAGRTSFARSAAAKLEGIWEAPVGGQPIESPEKEAMRRAFLATGKPYAAAVFATASAILDRYARRWTELYVEVCEATHVRGEQSAEVLDLRMACLNEGLADLAALCRLFREATGQVVENAVKAADALGSLERCNDVKLLRSVMRPPEDDATRAAVERLRQQLVEARALLRVGRVQTSMAAVGPLIEEARTIGYGPMLAEVLLAHGYLHAQFMRTGQSNTLEEAYSEAESARHDEVAATAAIYLIFEAGYVQARFDAAEVWCRCAEALLRRMGGHDLLWGWFLSNRASVREQQGRLEEAIADARRAIEMKERALGPHSPDIALTLKNLASHLAFSGDFISALQAVDRAIAIYSETLSLEHPEIAFCFASKAQFLYRLSRFEEARRSATEARRIVEREAGPQSIWVSMTMRTLGLCDLAERRYPEAVASFRRAVAIRETSISNPLHLAEVHAPLARALYQVPGERKSALALAKKAREEYARAAKNPVVDRDIADLDAWLAQHAKPARRAAKPARATSRPRKAPPKAAKRRARGR